MTYIGSDSCVPAETTEEALVRVEAECGWSDASIRLAEVRASERGAVKASDDDAG